MKHIFFALMALAMSAAHAQTEKGTLLPGGGIMFQTSENGTYFSVSPSLGVFVKNNLAIGAAAGITLYDDGILWSFGPFIKKYFGKSSKGKFFIGAGGLLIGGNDTDLLAGYSANAGYAIFLNQSIALEMDISFQHLGNDANLLSLGTGFRMHIKR